MFKPAPGRHWLELNERLCICFNRAAWLAPFTFLVALSRMVLGLHYPSDVLAGISIGAFVASASL